MDKTAPWTVLQGTLTISAVSATTIGIWGILRGQEHYGFLAGAAALNGGITAAAFFSLREYIISPILVHTLPFEQYEMRRRVLGIGQSSPGSSSTTSVTSVSELSSIRSHRVLDSALSGIITGGLLRGWKSGLRAGLSGSVSVGVTATLLQLGYNEFGVQRLKYISRQRSPEDVPPSTSLPQPVSSMMVSEDVFVQESTSWKAKALSLLGVRKMSEEEYLRRLKLQRDHHLMRIKELEQKLEEEKKGKENAG